ncbi:MAG: hypothetical protein ACLFP8_07000 [Alphaproteobacteria bacterium]
MNKKKQKKQKEPELFEKSYMAEQGENAKRPPYIYIAIIVLFLLLVLVKNIMGNQDEEQTDTTTLPRSFVARSDDMAK